MELQILFTALSKAIMISLIQGLIIYIFTKMALSFYPQLKPAQRYKALYGAMMLMAGLFILTLVRSYSALQASFSQVEITVFSPMDLIVGVTDNSLNLNGIVGWLYLTGMVVHLFYVAAGIFQLGKIKQNSIEDLYWTSKLDFLKEKFAIQKSVNLRFSSGLLAPFTAGYLKPIIIIPIAIINRLSHAEVEAILLHELSHIKRSDYLYNMIQKLVESILFFNPFMWLLSKEIRIEREFSCDDLVIKGNQDPLLYAHALLKVAESNLKLSLSGIPASGPGKFTLLTRIKRLNDMKTSYSSNPKSGLLGLVGIVMAGISLAWVAPQKPVESPDITKLSWISTDTLSKLSELNKPTDLNANLNSNLDSSSPIFHLSSNVDTIPNTPDSKMVINGTEFSSDTDKVSQYFKSPEWKAQMELVQKHALEVQKQVNSPQWKKQVEEMTANALKMQNYTNSPEFKKMIETAQASALEISKNFDSPEWKQKIAAMTADAENMRKKFDSPEWKENIKKMTENAMEMQKKFDTPEWKEHIKKMELHGLEMQKKFDSPEWKEHLKQMELHGEEMKKKFESPEWKNQILELQKQSEKLKELSEKDAKEKRQN